MKKLFTTALLASVTSVAMAQTNATNWTANDCNGMSHTLFNTLDSGKVIVFAWVMPCGSCVGPSTTAYNVVQNFASSNPGQVRFYLADDLGDASCTTLTNWINSNSIGNTANMTIFSNSGNVINENDFGGTGMPHVVVLAGTDHKIYFNKKNSQANDQAGITAAINSALQALSVNSVSNEVVFSVSPNPITENFSVSYTRAIKNVTVTSVNGQVVKEETFTNGKMNPTINMSEAASGVYMIKVTDIENNTGIQKVVKQ